MKRTKREQGITLIALIITIIVLLILAVVAISAVQDDGIIGYAKNARGEYEKAGANENSTLQGYLDKIEDNLPPIEVTKGVKITKRNGIYTEKAGDKTLTAIIPVGFCVVKGEDNTIEKGLVISDVADDDLDNSKKGNQFVWIPVEDYNKFHLIEGYETVSLQSCLNVLKEAGDTDAEVSNSPNKVKGTAESIAMYNSVKTNKGFYIARFEAGKPDTTIKTDGTVKPLSQKGVNVWNIIPWGGTYSKEASDGLQGNDNANGAVKVARSMYTKSSECGVTSTLCYGVQWDAVMNFIDPNYYTGECSEDSFVRNSNEKGNHSRDFEQTGYYEQNHIFDLAGNVWEWTMEAFDTSSRVSRGGHCYDGGLRYPASSRYDYNPDFTNDNLRFSCGFIFVVLSAVKTKI